MAREISSISRTGTTEPFELQLSRGQISWHSTLFKFGFNSVVGTSNETIWDGGGLYAYPAAAAVMYVSSSSTNDAAAGTGARTIQIEGLDVNYEQITETVTLNGQTQVATTKEFLRVFRAYVATAGSGGTAAGDIYIGTTGASSGVPTGTYYAKITLGENQTLMAVYTVPANHTLYVGRGSISTGTENANKFIKGRFAIRTLGGVFRTQTVVTLSNGFIDFDWEIPLGIPEKTDIEARAISSSGDQAVAATFEGVLIRNGDSF